MLPQARARSTHAESGGADRADVMPHALLQELPYHHGARHPLKIFLGYVVFGPATAVPTGSVESPVLDVYEDSLYLHWRYRPDIEAFLAAFREEFERARPTFKPGRELPASGPAYDLELQVGAGEIRRSLGLEDDLGTHYRGYGGGDGGKYDLSYVDGTLWFEPSLPSAASWIRVRILDVTFTATLTPEAPHE